MLSQGLECIQRQRSGLSDLDLASFDPFTPQIGHGRGFGQITDEALLAGRPGLVCLAALVVLVWLEHQISTSFSTTCHESQGQPCQFTTEAGS